MFFIYFVFRTQIFRPRSSGILKTLPYGGPLPSISRGGSKSGQWAHGPLSELRPPVGRGPPNETGCKVAGLHNSCIHSVASHSWCKVTPLTQSCIRTSSILSPKYVCGHPVGHPKLLQLETPLSISCLIKALYAIHSFWQQE